MGMREYVSEAVVLAKMPSNHNDARYSIFTKRFGKMVAKGVSARKITSKLAGHLEPGTLARVRLIERGGLTVVDALKERRIGISLSDLNFLSRLLAENEPEPFVWDLLEQDRFSWDATLQALGWDSHYARCVVCGTTPVAGFSVVRQEFFCARCTAKMFKNEMIMLGFGQ
jgi:recombinational DNA repair protein (RecF pathway)